MTRKPRVSAPAHDRGPVRIHRHGEIRGTKFCRESVDALENPKRGNGIVVAAARAAFNHACVYPPKSDRTRPEKTQTRLS
ncbi:hypothetical protein EVAR_61307_1 [Eumeta japonica]|uniref:Uncharacterized protein n=1 Tax=Eumeta variegata TaxID=151549 RepID=A0A4C1XMQ3_EUMVA|nr:hypothetical protein EVAR_61307_1 [Eumeta japonica]